MYKRPAEGEPGGSEPPAKKIVFQPLQLGAITNLEELDLKTLQFQNRYRPVPCHEIIRTSPALACAEGKRGGGGGVGAPDFILGSIRF